MKSGNQKEVRRAFKGVRARSVEAMGQYGKKPEKNQRPFYLMANARFLVGDDKWVRFWKDLWCGEEALCLSFPSLLELAALKEAMMAKVRDSTRDGGCWSLCFTRSFNGWSWRRQGDFCTLYKTRSYSQPSG